MLRTSLALVLNESFILEQRDGNILFRNIYNNFACHEYKYNSFESSLSTHQILTVHQLPSFK